MTLVSVTSFHYMQLCLNSWGPVWHLVFIFKGKCLFLWWSINQSNDQSSHLQLSYDRSFKIEVRDIFHFHFFSVGDVMILCTAQDSGLRIISRLRFNFDGAKSQRNPCGDSAPTSEKMVGCSALPRLLQSWSHQMQFRKEKPLQPWPSAALGRKGMEGPKCKRKRGRLTGASGSDLC